MQGLAETLLTLDMPGRICGSEMKPGTRVRLSPLGCAMLTTLLSFPQVQVLSVFTAYVARLGTASAQLVVAAVLVHNQGDKGLLVRNWMITLHVLGGLTHPSKNQEMCYTS